VSGFLAWATWLIAHLWYLIGFQNRLLVLIGWSFSFTHPRAWTATCRRQPKTEQGAATQY
jgi:NADH dehydrogenase FAD-containing subunit